MTDQDRWKNRRRMAWLCMGAGIGYPLLVLGTNSRELGEIAIPFYMFVSAVVGAYIGFATVDDKWRSEGSYPRNKDWRNDFIDQDNNHRGWR